MLRTLIDEGHDGEIGFLHFARTQADWLYEPEVRALAARHPGLRVAYRATRGAESRRLDAPTLRELLGDAAGATAAVCGPPGLVEAAPAVWAELGGDADRLLAETFTPPRVLVTGDAADGDAALPAQRPAEPDRRGHAARAGRGRRALSRVRLPDGHLPHLHLPQGRRRRAQPAHRRGLRRRDEDIQLCISAPAGDVALEL